jgi:hypothetical protein
VHARYGPLLSEATDGMSKIPMGVLLKVVRDVLRNYYSAVVPEVADLPDRIRAMGGGDEVRARGTPHLPSA